MNNKKQEYLKGQVWYCDLSPVKGSEQGGVRPCVIIQNNVGNEKSPTVIVAIITSRHTKAKLPTHTWISTQCGLRVESMVELEQVRTIDKSRLKDYMGMVTAQELKNINKALIISLGL